MAIVHDVTYTIAVVLFDPENASQNSTHIDDKCSVNMRV
nr:MAG TPA: hypothetical protein [Caudoviricetes sp.]